MKPVSRHHGIVRTVLLPVLILIVASGSGPADRTERAAAVVSYEPVPTEGSVETPPVPEGDARPGVATYGESFGNPFAPAVVYDPNVPQPEPPPIGQFLEHLPELLSKPAEPAAEIASHILHAEHDRVTTSLSSQPLGMRPIPGRPRLLVETGERFLAPGFLKQGIRLPTGAIWRPSLWVFGTLRTGVSYFDSGAPGHVSEWANRLDLFSQLNLTGTERLVLGLRPLDEQAGAVRRFTGYDFDRGRPLDAWNDGVQTLFFEGDFGEIFPRLDPDDRRALDWGFSVGRQPMLFQQGLLLNEDRIDAVTVTRNTLQGHGHLNVRVTAVWAWNDINRMTPAGLALPDGRARLIGLFTESDVRGSTINADIAWVWSDRRTDDLLVTGLSAIQRISGYRNIYNSSVHFLASFPTTAETPLAGQGELLFSQFSWTPHHTHDLVYLNAFWAIDQFTSASRGPLAGGPLGQTGILFTAPGLGRYAAPLNSQATNVVGASLGYQMFFDDTRQQLILEVGGRQDTDSTDQAAAAAGFRWQKKLSQHWLIVVDGFVSKREGRGVGQGGRVEFQMKF